MDDRTAIGTEILSEDPYSRGSLPNAVKGESLLPEFLTNAGIDKRVMTRSASNPVADLELLSFPRPRKQLQATR